MVTNQLGELPESFAEQIRTADVHQLGLATERLLDGVSAHSVFRGH